MSLQDELGYDEAAIINWLIGHATGVRFAILAAPNDMAYVFENYPGTTVEVFRDDGTTGVFKGSLPSEGTRLPYLIPIDVAERIIPKLNALVVARFVRGWSVQKQVQEAFEARFAGQSKLATIVLTRPEIVVFLVLAQIGMESVTKADSTPDGYFGMIVSKAKEQVIPDDPESHGVFWSLVKMMRELLELKA